MAGNATESGRSVTSRIAAILLTFTEGSEHTLTEIARWAGLPISTAHRLIAEMTLWRLLERTPEGLYRAGLRLRMISGGPSPCPSLEERAPCVVEDLAVATRYRVRLGVRDELDVAYIEKCPDHRPVTAFNPVARLPAHPTALGRALLAFSPPGIVEMTIRRGLRPYTSHTVTCPDRFRRALAIIRVTRAAVTRYELEAQACTVAMPVFGPGGSAVAAIELTVPDVGVATLQPALTALTIATRSLARELTGPSHTTSVDWQSAPDDVSVRRPVRFGWHRVDALTHEARCCPAGSGSTVGA
jgi:DNA-binding IclR family transcriptional regulator